MYDVMIIDDDIHINERLTKIIEWEKHGAQLVCQAQDSDTARELFDLHRPKIIITDIQIPIISGLDLAKEILSLDPSVRFIIITGFTDFYYAQTSVRLGAVDLISKPISRIDINASISKAIAYFEELKDQHVSSQNVKLLLKENLPSFQLNYISYMLEQKREFTAEEIAAKLYSLNLDILGSYYNIAIVCPKITDLTADEIDTVLVVTKSTFVQQLAAAGYKVYAFYNSDYHLICLISWERQTDHEKLEEILLNAKDKINFYWNINIHSGFAIPTSDITTLNTVRNQAYTALNSQDAIEGSPIVDFKNVLTFDAPLILDNKKQISQIVIFLKNNRLEAMANIIETELNAIFNHQNNCIALSKQFVFELTVAIITESVSLGIDIDVISKHSGIYSNIFSSEDLESLKKYVFDFARNISFELARKRLKSKNMLITMAKDYLIKNLENNKLNLDIVSNEIGLSSIYFCKLFHKEEGISFNTFLNNMRVNKAKELLCNTNLKVFEVANATGYNNPKYFNYVFKRIAGVTPLEYRNSNG